MRTFSGFGFRKGEADVISVKDASFMRLWDLYNPLLTDHQRELTDLYFNYDLSLGEIAEQKGVSRQSVSDCLAKSRKQLEDYEEKLGFLNVLSELKAENESLKRRLEACETIETAVKSETGDRPTE